MKIDRKSLKNKVKPDYLLQEESWGWLPWWCGLRTYPLCRIEFHRSPKTLNERREWYALKCDGVLTRGRRSAKMIPNSYDDIRCSASSEMKSWKRSTKRRKQWKYE